MEGVSVDEVSLSLLYTADYSSETVINNLNLNEQFWLSQVLLFRRNLLDLAWRLKLLTPKNNKKSKDDSIINYISLIFTFL